MYTKLSVVNEMLGQIGELPVNSLDTPHPSIPACLLALDSHMTRIQAEGWWFNTEYPTLTPQAGTGLVLLPNNTLAADSITPYPELSARGARLYNNTESTYVFSAPVKVKLRRFLDFDELPYTARFYIASSAKLAFQSEQDGDSTKTRKLAADKSEHYVAFHAEHIRAIQANMIDRPTFAWRLRRIVGDSPFPDSFVR
jgi:hypothetical protein